MYFRQTRERRQTKKGRPVSDQTLTTHETDHHEVTENPRRSTTPPRGPGGGTDPGSEGTSVKLDVKRVDV